MSTALITGGAQRIGRAIALSLAQQGYDIAITYNTSATAAEQLGTEIERTGRSFAMFHCNLLDDIHISTLINTVRDAVPDLAILINNASIFERSPLHDTDYDMFDRHMTINFRAPYFLSRDFAHHCDSGQIINIIDTKIQSNAFQYSAYTLSKKALADFTKMAALELAPAIRVNAICPGLILPPPGEGQAYLDNMAQHIPLKTTGSTGTICQAIHFLLNNKFITGQFIFIDGGQHL